MWWLHTMNPSTPIDNIAYIIPMELNTGWITNLDITWDIVPNAGNISMYTSGWPKNQNRCWYRIGSPPYDGSKNPVFKLRSVNYMVYAPANTGNDNSSNHAVICTDHANKGRFEWTRWIPAYTVVIRLILPNILDIPATWRLSMD